MLTNILRIEFSIPTDSVALEGNESFSISATISPQIANEFVADPLIVTIQDVNGTQCGNSYI